MAAGLTSRLLSAAFLGCVLASNVRAQHDEYKPVAGSQVQVGQWFFSGGPLNEHVPAEIRYESGYPYFIWYRQIEPHYLWKPAGPVSGNTLTLRYELEVLTGVPQFQVVEERPGSYDPKISIVIQRRGDPWTGQDSIGALARY